MKKAIIWLSVSTKKQADDSKDSLQAQERDSRALAEKEGWTVIDVLRVPGHSRRYTDIHECARDMMAQGIDAFMKLLQHWKQRDFDVLIVRDGDRFARTQALHARVVEDTINCGAVIYSLADGLVDTRNYRMWIAMKGYQAAAHVDRLMELKEMGLAKNAQLGLPIGRLPLTHKAERDTNGKALRIVVNEEYRHLWDDAARLLLQGVPYRLLEVELFQRYGYTNPKTGKPFPGSYFFKCFHNPITFGHIARKWRAKSGGGRRNGGRSEIAGAWAYDKSVPPPEGVTLDYDVVQPLYSGAMLEQLITELNRRSDLQGHASPEKTHMFSGLAVCGTCGYSMVTYVNRRHGKVFPNSRSMRCSLRWQRQNRPKCTATAQIRYSAIKTWLSNELDVIRETGIVGTLESPAVTPAMIDALETQTTQLQQRIANLIREQSSAPEALASFYRHELAALAEQLKGVNTRLIEARSDMFQIEQASATQHQAIAYLRKTPNDEFWSKSEREINQTLRQALGDLRILVVDGKIKGLSKRTVS